MRFIKVRCPACGEIEGTEVAYGYPGPPLEEAAERGEVLLGGCEPDVGSPGRICRACGRDVPVAGVPGSSRMLIGPEDVTPEVYAEAVTILRDRALLFHEVAEGIRAGLDTDPRRAELRGWMERTHPDDPPWSDPLSLRTGHHDLVVPRELAHLLPDLDASTEICAAWDSRAPVGEPPGDRWVIGRRRSRWLLDYS